MKTATLTILRRLLATALGALGLGAFAGGSANAQQIPAPDLFDGQVACSTLVPTPPMSLGMEVATKVMSGMTILVNADGTADTDDDLIPTGADAGLADILYVIDPNLGNCGAGYVMDEDGNFLDADGSTTTDPTAYVPVAIDEGVAADVGAGYTDVLAKFMAVVEADADVEAKQTALNMLLEDDTADVEQTTLITNARTALTTSQGEQTKAHNALYAATGPDRDGSIYRAGVAEWRAKGAVEKAIGDWNTAVTALETAEGALNTNSTTFADYVPLQNSSTTAGQILSLIADPAMADSAVNLANLRTYANAEGGTEATQDSMTGAITGTSNFDAAGNLLIPQEDADSDAATPLTQVKVATAYSAANTQITQINNVVTALEKLQSENQNALLQETIDEAVRRAKLEQAHYQAQFDALVADNTDQDTGTDGVQSFKTMYDAVRTAMTKRDNAGVALETAVMTREAATAAVRAAFTNPQSFYQQLVDRRQYLKDNADAEVTRLAGLTGDETPTAKQTEDAAKAASDAQEALQAAQATQASFQGLIADDSPVKDLVLETLKPNDGEGKGDDGGVLVGTIDNAFTAAETAQTAATNAETKADLASEAVAGLTAMDDPETEQDETGAVTANTNEIASIKSSLEGLTGEGGQVGQNTADIETLDGRVTANEEEIGMDDDGMSRIDHNENRSMANAAEIGMDEDGMSRIDHNEARSMANATAIGVNEGNISANKQAIADEAEARMTADTTLMGHITTNAESIMTNAGNIATNAGNIMTNAEAIGTNAGNIMTNAGNISTNAADIMTNAGNIAANNTAIMTNAADIMTNAGNIATNNTAIMTNAGNIAANNTAIMANRDMIASNREMIDTVKAGVASAVALAGMPEIGDRGVSVGAGTYDGESAIAVGVHFSGENSRFKLAISSADGETSASVGAGWSF